MSLHIDSLESAKPKASTQRTTSGPTSCRASGKDLAIILDNFARGMPSIAGFHYLYEQNREAYFDIV